MQTTVPHPVTDARPATLVSGHDRGFEDLFREHYWPMVRTLTVVCGDREAAADAVQDAFGRAYARWSRVSGYDDPAAWVRHVALNRVRDHFRHSSRAARLLQRIGPARETTAPAPELADDELGRAVASLPRQQRTAVSLFYLEQLTVREIAASMGLSDGAVKYHLHAGRAALRATLEDR